MESIIKKLFSGLRSQKNINVPEDFSWDNMKEGIFEKMAEDDNKPIITVNNQGRNKWIKRSLLLLLFLACSYILTDNLIKINNKSPEVKANKELIEREQIKENVNATTVDALSNKSNIENKLIKPDSQSDENNKESNLNSGKTSTVNSHAEGRPLSQTRPQNKISRFNKVDNLISTQIQSSADPNNSNSENKLKSINLVNNKINEADNNSESSESQNNTLSSSNIDSQENEMATYVSANNSDGLNKVKSRSFQNNLNKVLSKATPEIKLNLLYFNENKINIVDIPDLSPWSIGIIAGVGLPGKIPIKYNSSYNFYAKETGLISPYIRLYAKKELKNNFFIIGGAEYQANRSYLEFRRDSMMKYLLRDTILSVTENLITGETSYERGDTLVDALFSHKVKHLNVTNVVNIPVLIGYNFNSGRFKVGISAGASFNIFTRHTGRTYNLGAQIVDINLNDEFMVKNVGISLLANLNLGYRLSPHYNLVMEAGYQKYLKNWRKERYAEEWRPAQVRVGIGVEYRF